MCSPYPTCSWLRNYGAQPWQNNTAWVWWVINLNPTMDQNALVNMKIKFHERDPMTGADTYFCSLQLEHYLWNTTSDKIGSPGC